MWFSTWTAAPELNIYEAVSISFESVSFMIS